MTATKPTSTSPAERRVIAIILARGGSKGIPGKNLRPIAGQPLIAHSIAHARATREIDAIYVSTDDAAIARIARECGADVVERPAALATDTATSESALQHALDTLRAGGAADPSAVVFLQPTSPKRASSDIAEALRTFWQANADSLFSATHAHGFVWRVGSDGPKPLNYDPHTRPRRQDAPEDVIENGSIYIFKPWVLREFGSRLGGKIAVHRMKPENSFQVDEQWELHLLDWLCSRRDDVPSTSPSVPVASVAAVPPSSAQRIEGAFTGAGPVPPSSLAYFARREPEAEVDYESSYWGEVIDPDGNRRDRSSERAQHLADVSQELGYVAGLTPGKLIDVGCGLGFFLSGVSDAWEKHGVEVSAYAADRARAYGQIHHGDLASARHPDEHFDVVVLHHVIEHVADPLALMRESLRILKPGGRLVLGTPDFDGAMARRYGERYRMLHDKTHVSLFSAESMHRMLRDLGLVIEQVEFPYFETRHFTRENLVRLLDTEQLSPPFHGSFMTFYCQKPQHADLRDGFMNLRRKLDLLLTESDDTIYQAGACVARAVAAGRKVLACGNGGSAADAQHFAAELVGRLKQERRPLPAISLSSDPSVVTCIANDYGYDQLFARQVEAFGGPDDVLVAISTSGRSPNVLAAARMARTLGMRVVSLTGADGSALEELSDICVRVPSRSTQCIQELHMAILHTICAAVDQRILGKRPSALD